MENNNLDDLTILPDEGGMSLFDEENNVPVIQDPSQPLEVEKESEEEMSELLKGFKERAKKEDNRSLDVGDSEYWICMCFQTREQKEEFLTKLNLIQYGDKYLDGMQVAKELNINLESRIPPIYKTRAFDKEYIEMSMDLD